MTSTTGTTLESYLDWFRSMADKKADDRSYGKITLTVTVNAGQLVDAEKINVDHDHYPKLPKVR